MTRKADLAALAALAALGVGAQEQVRRMPAAEPAGEAPPKRIPVNVQFSGEGLAMLRQAQAKLLDRGVPRASTKGVALEIVLQEWLAARP
jgi:hypothetical protein